MRFFKNKSLRVAPFLFLFLCGGIFESCNPCGSSDVDLYFRITQLEVVPMGPNGEPVSRFEEGLNFFVKADLEYFSSISQPSFPGFFGKAYACSPAEPLNADRFYEYNFSVNTDFRLGSDTIFAGTNLITDPRTVNDIRFARLDWEYDELIQVDWDSTQVDFPPGEHTFYFRWKGDTREIQDSVKVEVGL